MSSVSLFILGLGLLALQRAGELVISQRHAARALARGGVEFGRGHLAAMSALHTAFFFACATEVLAFDRPFVPALGLPMLGIALAAQALRLWTMHALGDAWNVRVIVIPGVPVATGGPYRWLRHPNYLAVIAEGVAIPLIHGAYLTALAFSLANAVLLRVRIRCEENALERHGTGARQLAQLGRFVPRLASASR